MDYRIDEDVALPPSSPGRPLKYPMKTLKRGQSFLLACSLEDRRCAQTSMTALAQKYKPKKFSTRQVADGVRVWRVR